MNTVNLIGRLTKDVEMKYTPNGKAVANFTLAVKKKFKPQNGEPEADFILITVWGKQAENAANFLNKGSQAGVVGSISTRSYENQEGKRVYVTEVVADYVQFLDSRNSNSNGNSNQNGQQSNNNQNYQNGNGQQSQQQNNGNYNNQQNQNQQNNGNYNGQQQNNNQNQRPQNQYQQQNQGGNNQYADPFAGQNGFVDEKDLPF